MPRIELEAEPHKHIARIGEFQYHSLAARLQHSAHLSQSLLQVFKISYPKGNAHSAERAAWEGHLCCIALQKFYGQPLYPSPSNLKHSGREVYSYNAASRWRSLYNLYCKIACAGGNIQHLCRSIIGKTLDNLPNSSHSPYLVIEEGGDMVKTYIILGNIVKHCLYKGFLWHNKSVTLANQNPAAERSRRWLLQA